MDSEKLEALLRIVDCGSIQGAARQLGVTRASLRRILENLEAEVGTPLFHRDSKGVQLTAAGTVVAEQGRAVLESCRTLLSDARAAIGEATGVLRVAAPVGIPLMLQSRILLLVHDALPQVRVALRLVEDPVAEADGPFELLLHEGPAPDRGTWFSRVIFRAQLRLAASASYLGRRGTPQAPSELSAHDVLGWRRPGVDPGELPLTGGGVVRVAPWVTVADPQILHTLACGGGGIVCLPDLPFIHEPGSETLDTLLPGQVGGEIVFRISSPFPIRADSRTRGSLKLILDHLEALPQL